MITSRLVLKLNLSILLLKVLITIFGKDIHGLKTEETMTFAMYYDLTHQGDWYSPPFYTPDKMGLIIHLNGCGYFFYQKNKNI